MSDSFKITTDYSKNIVWELRDEDRTSVKIATVGKLAQSGSTMGYQVSIQKDAMNQLIDEVEAIRDVTRSLSSQGFPELMITDSALRPPESVDVANVLGTHVNSLSLNEADRLVNMADWLKSTFSPWVGASSPLLDFPDVKITFRASNLNSDSWLILKNIYPLPVLPPDQVPRSADGNIALNKPFSVEGDTTVYMMYVNSSGNLERVKVNMIQEVFSPDRTIGAYEDYLLNLVMARSESLVAKLPATAVASAPYDVIAWRYPASSGIDSRNHVSALPIVDTTIVLLTASGTFGPIQAPAGSLIKSPVSAGSQEFRYFLAKVANPSKPADVTEVIVDISKKYLLGLSDEERQTVMSQFGDTVITLTQRSSQQSVYLNELMQKMALFLDAASNALKAMTDSENRIAAGI